MPYLQRHHASAVPPSAGDAAPPLPARTPQVDPACIQFLETLPAMMWLADLDGRLFYANEAWCVATGLAPGPDAFSRLETMVHPDDLARLGGDKLCRAGGSTSFEFRLRQADGTYRWVLERIRPWRDARGNALGYIGSAIDIDEHKRHEHRLSLIALRQTSLACFGRFILEQTDAALVADEALRLFCEHLRLPVGLLLRPRTEGGPIEVVATRGLPPEVPAPRLAAVPAPALNLQHPDDAEFPLEAAWIEAAGWRHGIAVPVDPQAPARGCFVGLAPAVPEGAAALHFARDLAAIFAVAEARELAERRLREGSERAVQVQKMEAVGLLAGGVAHDFNNLLTAMRCFAELLRDDLVDETQRSRVDDILHASSRASHLVRQLLAFSRHELVQSESVDMNALVDNLRGFIRSLLSEHVRIDYELGGESAWCKADPKQIEQVLFNLCLNARDVMIAEGVLTVSVRPGPLSLAGGRQVRLSVGDTGPGIPPEVQARLFQPFFTTKARGRGTGLGLAASRAIAREFGGDLTYETTPGRGTVFHLDLPEAASPLSCEIFPESEAADRPPARTILLVEDDELVRAVTQLLAEARGHKVIAFGDSREAAAWAEAGGLEQIDLLMTDIVMPGMSGHVLALRLRERRPDLAVLYMSGYVDDDATRVAIAQPGVLFLAKPFSNADLTARLDSVFAAPRPGAA
jgi:two-component system cell cycle sensor histidine kinase/response regulator CckA